MTGSFEENIGKSEAESDAESNDNISDMDSFSAHVRIDIPQNLTILSEIQSPASPDYSNLSQIEPESVSIPIRNYQCSIELCNKTFEKRYQLNKHRNTHFPKHQCRSVGCERLFAVKRDRDRHEMDRHPLKSKFACPIDGCKRQKFLFKSDDSLLRHLEKVHLLNTYQRTEILRTG